MKDAVADGNALCQREIEHILDFIHDRTFLFDLGDFFMDVCACIKDKYPDTYRFYRTECPEIWGDDNDEDDYKMHLALEAFADDYLKRHPEPEILVAGCDFYGGFHFLKTEIIDRFVPGFAPESTGIYLSDYENKFVFQNTHLLEKAGVDFSDPALLPDIILLDENNGGLFFVEADLLGNGLTCERLSELKRIAANSEYEKKYVSAFPDMLAYRQSIDEQAWGTFAWIADQPGHIVYYE
jgi:hypothetical protein